MIHFNNQILDDWFLINGTCSLAPFIGGVIIFTVMLCNLISQSVWNNFKENRFDLDFWLALEILLAISQGWKNDSVGGDVNTAVELLSLWMFYHFDEQYRKLWNKTAKYQILSRIYELEWNELVVF